ncbi:CSC1 protein HYP1 [Trifolium repens]|nr:CSC1 protein HYP1 [Trifolium repens]
MHNASGALVKKSNVVYTSAEVSQGKVQEGTQFNSECLLPNAGWVRRAREPSDELISTAGLDAFVFIRIFVLSLKVFTFAGIVGTLILLPINYMGTEIRDNSEFQNKSLDSFSISNVNNGSHGSMSTLLQKELLASIPRNRSLISLLY